MIPDFALCASRCVANLALGFLGYEPGRTSLQLRENRPVLALDYVYSYQQASQATAGQVFMATSHAPAPFYFQGSLCSPRRTADLLLLLSRVVGSRFHIPPAMLARILRLADPVVTCGLDRMRWEGFSGCASVYARLDLLPAALDGALLAQGTTNVDFGPDMRAALTSLRDDTHCRLSVGLQQVELAQVVEKRVALPLRWLKGFVECQAHQANMRPLWEISAGEARRFFTQLPRGDASGHIVSAGKGVRLSQVASKGSLPIAGTQRLRLLEDAVRHCRSLRIYGNEAGASAWQLLAADAHFHLVLSPEPWRGFSGEGQVLEQLAQAEDSHDEAVSQRLHWGSQLSAEQLAEQARCTPQQIKGTLARLASRGRVGFDLGAGGYFYRPLPYDYSSLTSLHPRLEAARKLVQSGALEWEGRIAWVGGSEVVYRVVLEDGSCCCNCPWFAQHGNQRGPCKHILAAQMALSS